MCVNEHDVGNTSPAIRREHGGRTKLRHYTAADKLEQAERLVRLALRVWELKNPPPKCTLVSLNRRRSKAFGEIGLSS